MRVLYLFVLLCCLSSWAVSAPADKPSESEKTSEQTETTTDKNKKTEEAKSRPWEHEEYGFHQPPPGWPHGPVRQYCCPHPVQCQYPPHHLPPPPPPELEMSAYYRPPLSPPLPYPAYDGMQNRHRHAEPPHALPETSESGQTKSSTTHRQRKQSAEQK